LGSAPDQHQSCSLTHTSACGTVAPSHAIVNTAIAHENCQHIWQFPVVLLPFGHTTGESIVLRPVESTEAMTVTAAALPRVVQAEIVTELTALNAFDYVFLDLTNKPPGTIEWE